MPKSKLYRSSDFLKTLQNKPFCGFKCGQKKSGRLLKAYPITLSFGREPETVSSLNQYYLAAAAAASAAFLAFLAFLAFFFLALATGVVAAAGAAAAGAAVVVSSAITTPVPTNNTVNKATIKRFIQPP